MDFPRNLRHMSAIRPWNLSVTALRAPPTWNVVSLGVKKGRRYPDRMPDVSGQIFEGLPTLKQSSFAQSARFLPHNPRNGYVFKKRQVEGNASLLQFDLKLDMATSE